MKHWIADAVSLSRIALIALWIRCEIAGSPWALVVMAAIVASDLLDGPIARRLSTANERGALLDAACDSGVVVAAAVTVGLDDARYLGLAGLMAAAFVSWGAYSLVVGRLAYTRLGKYDGAMCYALVAAASAQPWLAALGMRIPAGTESVFIGLVAVYLGLSTAENIAGTLRARRRPSEAAAAVVGLMRGGLP